MNPSPGFYWMTWCGFRAAVRVFRLGSGELMFQPERGACQSVATAPDATWEAMP